MLISRRPLEKVLLNELAKGKIIGIVESGYTLADKIIRFAKVVVGK